MSLKFDSASEFLQQLAIHVEKINNPSRKGPEQFRTSGKELFRLGQVATNYSTGRPSIIFSGEHEASSKKYPYLSSYTPKAGDKVLLVRIANSYVIIGKII